MKKLVLISLAVLAVLNFSSVYGQKVIQIEAGVGQLAVAFAAADSGDIIELVTSGGIYTEKKTTKYNKAITIRAKMGLAEKPVIVAGTTDRPFEPSGNCTYFSLKGMKVTGLLDDGVTDVNDSTKYAIRVRNMNQPYTLVCENVDFENFVSNENPPEGYALRVDESAAFAEEITFKNCTFRGIAKHAIRMDDPTVPPGQVGKFTAENCTFADIAERAIDLTLMPGETDTATVTVNHCTFNNLGQDGISIDKGYRVTITNSIFTNIQDEILDSDSTDVQSKFIFSHCDTLNSGQGIKPYINLIATNIYAEDPEYADPANFDLTVSEFFKSTAMGDDEMVIGDLRWDPANPAVNGVIQITAGIDEVAAAVDLANTYDVEVIELLTSGGIYEESGTMKIKKAQMIRGAAGLENKPVIVSKSPDRPFEPTGACTGFWLSDLKISGLVDDGVWNADDSTKYAMRVRKMNGVYEIQCENVDFDFFVSPEDPPEGYVIRLDGSAEYAREISFKNCQFTRIAKHVIRADEASVSPGQIGNLVVENCTFAAIAARGIDVTLIPDETDMASVLVNHCTFNDLGQDAIKIDNGFGVMVKNSIFTNIADEILDSDSTNVQSSFTFSHCDTLNAPDGFKSYLDLTTISVYAEDPEYADAANFNFTVSEFFKSNAVADDGKIVGDLRWDPANVSVGADKPVQPVEFCLLQNYPNPFNPETTIQYILGKSGAVRLTIFNMLGQKVQTLVYEKQAAGHQIVHWNGKDSHNRVVPSGIYYYRLEANDFSATRKMLLLK
jgi:hypothetical protein